MNNEQIFITKNAKQLYEQAKEQWGKQPQMQMVIEEMSELTKEICKSFRGKGKIDNLVDEIADVLIMLEQIIVMFNLKDLINKRKKEKLDRLEKMLELDKDD